MKSKAATKKKSQSAPKGKSSVVNVSKIIEFYEKLDPKVKARVRREIMRRAGDDEIARHAVEVREAKAELANRPASYLPEDGYDPVSDQLTRYFEDLLKTLQGYFPFDQYKSGDENRMDLIRWELIRAVEPLEWILKSYFRYEVKGLENVPRRGKAMIVSNHGILPLDGWFLYYEILRATGRWPRGMTDWRIFKFPFMRQFFMDMGVVVGSHENGDRLLQNEEMIFIMPGGSKEAWKSSKFRYRLIWKGRNGFIRLALRNRCPIIPSANVGTDETYHVFFDGYTTAYKFFRSRKAVFPISLPVGLGVLPLPVKMTQYVGEPIHLPYPPEAENDPAIVEECKNLVKSKVYELIDRGLQERQEDG
jgi:1-acyl-sn-glycerol-3-phosphate acyltransferase